MSDVRAEARGAIVAATRAALAARMTGRGLLTMLLARPVAGRARPGMGWLIPSLMCGIVPWVFALSVMAHLVAGDPAFPGFTGVTWVALVGHAPFAVVAAWVAAWREGDA